VGGLPARRRSAPWRVRRARGRWRSSREGWKEAERQDGEAERQDSEAQEVRQRTSSVSRNARHAICLRKRSLTCGNALVIVRCLLVVAICFAGFRGMESPPSPNRSSLPPTGSALVDVHRGGMGPGQRRSRPTRHGSTLRRGLQCPLGGELNRVAGWKTCGGNEAFRFCDAPGAGRTPCLEGAKGL
jgi:hypothetical protein